MVRAGMRVARLNFSHGDYEQHLQSLQTVRSVSEAVGEPVSILADLQGQKIRVGELPGGEMLLREGEEVWLRGENGGGGEGNIPVSYARVGKDVSEGDRVLLHDGLVTLSVVEVREEGARCKVMSGGMVKDRHGVDFPDSKASGPALTAKDLQDLDFAVRNSADYIALSCVRSAEDLREARRAMGERGASIPIIAKLETAQVLQHLEAVLEESDAAMVARGDLGVEVALERVPIIQKDMIRLCHEKAVPVITATEMLESMIHNVRPTRAETSDVANAVFDGTDAVMLSAETAVGERPVETVQMMARILAEAEERIASCRGWTSAELQSRFPFASAIAHSACQAAVDVEAKAIVAFTGSGTTARLLSKYRPPVPIYAFTNVAATLRRLPLLWGTSAFLVGDVNSTDEMMRVVDEAVVRLGLAKEGEVVVISGAIPVSLGFPTNMLKIHQVGVGAPTLEVEQTG
jgi:pyruvate kinase